MLFILNSYNPVKVFLLYTRKYEKVHAQTRFVELRMIIYVIYWFRSFLLLQISNRDVFSMYFRNLYMLLIYFIKLLFY